MGGKPFGFGDYEQTTVRKRTRRERFLAEMEAVVPWKPLIDLIEPHYPKTSSKGGRPAHPLATMLRVHLTQGAGIKTEGVVVGAGARAGAAFHRFPYGTFNGLAVALQIPCRLQRFLSAIEVSPPGHLGFSVLKGQQLSQQPLHPPAQASGTALLLLLQQCFWCIGGGIALERLRQLGDSFRCEASRGHGSLWGLSSSS
jgi:hypothetical protein